MSTFVAFSKGLMSDKKWAIRDMSSKYKVGPMILHGDNIPEFRAFIHIISCVSRNSLPHIMCPERHGPFPLSSLDKQKQYCNGKKR